MPAITENGIELYYELHGQGKPLVLIAGYTGDHTFWNLMVDKLARKFKVLVFDNRGIGQTRDLGEPFSLDTMAQDTLSLIEQLNLIKPHIIGQSMGGLIAQIIAEKYTDKMDRLVVLNSSSQLNVRTQKTLESLLNLRKANISFDFFINAALPWFFSSNYLNKTKNIEEFKRNLINNPYPQSIEDQERQLNALLSFGSINGVEINVPALIISAKEDIIALPEEGSDLAKIIPNSQFVLVPGAHSSPVEQPEKVCELIIHFLQDNEVRA